MTKYLSKLARRLACLYALVLVAACAEAAPRDFLGPDPSAPPPAGGPVSLQISPRSGTIAANQPLQFHAIGRTAAGESVTVAVSWTATGGQIGADGVFRSAAGGSYTVQGYVVGKPHLTDAATVEVSAPSSIFTSVAVSPQPASVPMGGTLQFSAHATLASGGTTPPSVTWSATGGTISPTGLYTAGMAPGTWQVTAATTDGAFTETVPVTVAAASLTGLQVQPAALTMSSGDQVDFTVQGAWNDGSTAAPPVTWTSTAGPITETGRLTAGATPGVFAVVARHVPSGRADTALVTIMAAVARIEVTPATVELQPGAQRSFSAVAVRTDGVTLPVAVTWQATGGTISTAGVYSAGSQEGQYRVIARYLGGALADTALVTIAVPGATLTGLSLTPATAAVGAGTQLRFEVVPTWSDGSSALPALQWSATGGAVSGDGTWTAPVTAGSYRVVARHAASGLADTATVTVTEGPRVTAVVVSPAEATTQTGGTIQFSAQATWSDGVSRPVEWLWSSTGGTISVNGLFSAGNLAGQVLVIASCVGCAAADTTGVTVNTAPPPAATLVSLTLNPSQAFLNPGDVLPMHLSASWSDGSTQVPDIAWTVQGGTRSGLYYTAGSAGGSYLVIARHAAGTVADTLAITIDGPAVQDPALTSLVLNPSSVTMNPGEKRTLTLAATWSDGSNTVPPVSWDVTGGTLSGLTYTAGATPGSFRIIVRHQGGTRADTTAVTVVAAPVTVVALSISPNPATVTAGFSLAFSATATMSDSTTTTPAVTWAATGGTISSSGMYTAGPTGGTYQVTAVHAGSGLSAVRAVTITSSGGGSSSVELPEAPRVWVNSAYQQPSGTVRDVPAGGNLQAVINAAQCGDRILLASGATFTGPFTLPNKNCSGQWIEISTATTLPPEGTRVTPATAVGYAKLVSPGLNQPALSAAAGASHYRIMGVEFGSVTSATTLGALVVFHVENPSSVSQLPSDIILDRVVIRGNDNLHLQRCVQFNARRAAIIDSYLAKCHGKGYDTQAIVLWNTPGPIKIVNNYLEGAGENLMIGGADPKSAEFVPADIEIRRNHFYKPPQWFTSQAWSVKNSLELKLGKRVLIEGNVIENNWADAQVGFAVLIWSVNQGGGATWSETSDVMFRNNIIFNSPHGINLAARYGAAVPMQRVAIVNNLIYRLGNLSDFNNSGAGRGFQLDGGIRSLTIQANTMVGSHAHAFVLHGNQGAGTLFLGNNLVQSWITSADGKGYGVNALDGHLQSWQASHNVFVFNAAHVATQHPVGSQFANTLADVGFSSLASHDYRLSAGSPFRGKGVNGSDPGADVPAVLAATLGVR